MAPSPPSKQLLAVVLQKGNLNLKCKISNISPDDQGPAWCPLGSSCRASDKYVNDCLAPWCYFTRVHVHQECHHGQAPRSPGGPTAAAFLLPVRSVLLTLLPALPVHTSASCIWERSALGGAGKSSRQLCRPVALRQHAAQCQLNGGHQRGRMGQAGSRPIRVPCGVFIMR